MSQFHFDENKTIASHKFRDKGRRKKNKKTEAIRQKGSDQSRTDTNSIIFAQLFCRSIYRTTASFDP